jgi:hypothetical protein
MIGMKITQQNLEHHQANQNGNYIATPTFPHNKSP